MNVNIYLFNVFQVRNGESWDKFERERKRGSKSIDIEEWFIHSKQNSSIQQQLRIFQ